MRALVFLLLALSTALFSCRAFYPSIATVGVRYSVCQETPRIPLLLPPPTSRHARLCAVSAHSSNEDEDTRPNIVAKFENGASYVHNNYLDIIWSATRFTALPMALLASAVGIGYILSPTLGRSIVTVLLKILIQLAVVSIYVIQCLALPIIILGRLLLSQGLVPPGRRRVSELRGFNHAYALVMVLVVVPMLEEFIFRRVLLAGLKRLWPPAGSKEKDESNEAQPLIFGYTPWVLISSILFASSHIHNHTRHFLAGLSFSPTTEKVVIRLVLRAYAQCFITGYLSLSVFSPVFEANGLFASTGAHVWWNLNTIYATFVVPVRLIQRWRRNKKSKEDV